MSQSQQNGFILSSERTTRGGQSQLIFWLATDAGAVELITDPLEHVLFVTHEQVSELKQHLTEQNIAFRSQVLTLKTFQHQAVTAVYFALPTQLNSARQIALQKGITLFEDDIKLADRFLMERFVYGSLSFTGQLVQAKHAFASWQKIKIKPADYKPKLTLLSLDIECSDKGELYSIGLSSGAFQQVIMIGEQASQAKQDRDLPFITWVKDEKALLQTLVTSTQQQDPDILIGWSLVNFDFRVLAKRAKQLNVPLRLGRDGSAIRWHESANSSNQSFVHIAGRIAIDGIDALKSAGHVFESYSLEFVAQTLLGQGKKTEDVDDRLATIMHDFKHNKVKLAEYNLQDCVLVEQIFQQAKLMDYLILRSQITGLALDRAGGSVAAFINLYLPKLHRAGYISPNRPADGGLASPGGYVMNSRPGLYQHVLVLDYKSLYPSIIRTFKIDPLGLVEGLKVPDESIPGFRGACFSRDKHFLPDIITSLWQQRDEAKREQNQAKSQAIKILMNSFYGVLGSGGCPFYDTRLASSITLRGHEIMQTTAKWIEAEGYQVIYGDTDSTFVWIDQSIDYAKAVEIGTYLQNLINQRWQRQLKDELDLDNQLEIEFETYFSQFLMPTIRGSELGSKKRYAGLKQDGEQHTLIFKGLESVRSDWTALAKRFQQTLYERIFAQEDVSDYIQQTLFDLNSGKLDEALVYKKRLRQSLVKYQKNVPPHVKAARIADNKNAELGKTLKYQNKGAIQYVITVNGPEPLEYRSSMIDYQHYIDKQLKPIAEAILPFVGLSFDSLVSQQLTLFG